MGDRIVRDNSDRVIILMFRYRATVPTVDVMAHTGLDKEQAHERLFRLYQYGLIYPDIVDSDPADDIWRAQDKLFDMKLSELDAVCYVVVVPFQEHDDYGLGWRIVGVWTERPASTDPGTKVLQVPLQHVELTD